MFFAGGHEEGVRIPVPIARRSVATNVGGALGPSALYGASPRFEFLLAIGAIHARVNDSRPLFSGEFLLAISAIHARVTPAPFFRRYGDKLLNEIEGGEIAPSFVITHARSSDAPEMYKTLRDKKDNYIKVALKH